MFCSFSELPLGLKGEVINHQTDKWKEGMKSAKERPCNVSRLRHGYCRNRQFLYGVETSYSPITRSKVTFGTLQSRGNRCWEWLSGSAWLARKSFCRCRIHPDGQSLAPPSLEKCRLRTYGWHEPSIVYHKQICTFTQKSEDWDATLMLKPVCYTWGKCLRRVSRGQVKRFGEVHLACGLPVGPTRNASWKSEIHLFICGSPEIIPGFPGWLF